MTGFFINGVSEDEFVARSWRRRPLFVKGGARALFEQSLSEEDFHRLADEQERRYPRWVRRDAQRRAVFAQRLDRVSEPLEQMARQIGVRMAWPDISFDGTAAEDGGGVGCHFDDSDNFVMQQSGRKLWRLEGPWTVSLAQRRLRMLGLLGDPTLSDEPVEPAEALEFTLDPGDLLYIPVFWIHSGVSVGRSLSVSMVCGASNALDDVLPVIRRHLADMLPWWGPTPLAPARGRPVRDADGVDRDADEVLAALFATFADQEFQARVKREVALIRRGKVTDPGEEGSERAG